MTSRFSMATIVVAYLIGQNSKSSGTSKDYDVVTVVYRLICNLCVVYSSLGYRMMQCAFVYINCITARVQIADVTVISTINHIRIVKFILQQGLSSHS